MQFNEEDCVITAGEARIISKRNEDTRNNKIKKEIRDFMKCIKNWAEAGHFVYESNEKNDLLPETKMALKALGYTVYSKATNYKNSLLPFSVFPDYMEKYPVTIYVSWEYDQLIGN